MVPVVMVAVAEPIRVGLISSFNRPGGNITGLSLLTPELSPKRVQILVELVGLAPRLGTLSNPANASHPVFFEETLAAAKQIGVAIMNFDARNPEEIERAFQKLSVERVHALIVFDDPAIWSHRRLVVAVAENMRLPVMYGYSEFVRDGGLISYGPHRLDLYRRTASYVDKILKGAKPADLPVERPTRFELVVNLKAANALGLTIPPTLLAGADEVIE